MAAARHWEEDYSTFLPPGYTDFSGHWQSQDVGVRIFSFHCARADGTEKPIASISEVPSRGIHDAPKKRFPDHELALSLRRPVNYSEPGRIQGVQVICSERNSDKVFGMLVVWTMRWMSMKHWSRSFVRSLVQNDRASGHNDCDLPRLRRARFGLAARARGGRNGTICFSPPCRPWMESLHDALHEGG